MHGRSIILSCLLLAGCGSILGSGGGVPPALYDFGPSETPSSVAGRPFPAVLQVSMAQWLDTPAIHYRLLYADPGRLREYARSRWVGPPAQLVRQRLASRLAMDLSGRGESCRLHLDIDEFTQVFTSPQASHALLEGRLQWRGPAGQPLAERRVRIERPVADNDAAGGVAALASALGELSGLIDDWRRELGSGALTSCRR